MSAPPQQQPDASQKPSTPQTKTKPPKQPKSKTAPTPEEIERLRSQRASKRAAESAHKEAALAERRARDVEARGRGLVPVEEGSGRPLYVGREWAPVRRECAVPAAADGVERAGQRTVRVVSWNILAQGLIQRKLFPGSDALKWRDRSPGLTAELVGHAYDVGCFQEVDRFEVHSETLKHHGFAYEYQRGYRAKKHGLAIAWRTIPRPDVPNAAVFDPVPAGRALLFLDHASVSDPSSSSGSGATTPKKKKKRTACSRETRNIALIVAIRFAAPSGSAANGTEPDQQSQDGQRRGGGGGGGGLIVATTHTFWHPRHGYERARQVGVLVRELDRFRRREGAEWRDWDVVMAGDFNDQPDSATYELATGRSQLRDVALQEVAESMVVHSSVDEKLNAGNREEQGEAWPTGLVDITAPVGAIDGLGVELPGSKKTHQGSIDSNVTQNGAASDLGPSSNVGSAAAEQADVEDDDADGEDAEDEEEAEEQEGGEQHEVRILKNCRLAKASDGLLTFDELRQLYDLSRPAPSATGALDPARTPDPRAASAFPNTPADGVVRLRSAYGSFYNRLVAPGPTASDSSAAHPDGLEAGNFFGSESRGRERWNDPEWTHSEHVGDGYEPMWTIFSSLFSLTLDYVFLFPRLARARGGQDRDGASAQTAKDQVVTYPAVTALLRTHRTEVLQPGTPRRYVNASDHIAIGAEIVVADTPATEPGSHREGTSG